MSYPRGSEWRIWDLHVHTPASLVNTTYGAGGGDPWDQFLLALEALPPQFAVIGINDYIFLDGYKRVLAERANGRLQNLKLILPVIELRLSKFAGTEDDLSRINYHVIFSDELSPEQIEAQFLSSLAVKYQLAPGAGGKWSGIVTRESLKELGSQIIESSPKELRSTFPSPLITGFNNLCLNQNDIENVLRDRTIFGDRYLTAVGKAEWADLKWSAQAAATKKDLINSVDFVFTALPNHSQYDRHRSKLSSSEVNDRLLDCSDAHHLSDSKEPNRIGNCFSWVAADPTFKGLRHALEEFNCRVFVGSTPPLLTKVQSNATRYITQLDIKKVDGSSLKDIWFDVQLPLNYSLVAVIGNKGSGKSALADCIGLAGNTTASNKFSFLNDRKFRRKGKDKLSPHFKATLHWHSGTSSSRVLDHDPDDGTVELVKYIPQNYLEEICNDATGSAKFESELKAVIFSHVPTSDRLGFNSLDELIGFRTEQIRQSIRSERDKLARLNIEIIQREERLLPSFRRRLQELVKAKKEEISALESTRPTEVPAPIEGTLDRGLASELRKGLSERDSLARSIEERRKHLSSVKIQLAVCERLSASLARLRQFFQEWTEEVSADAAILELPVTKLANLQLDNSRLQATWQERLKLKSELELLLAEEGDTSLIVKLAAVNSAIATVEKKLSEPAYRHREYLEQLRSWNESMQCLVGDEKTEGTLKNLEQQILTLEKTPIDLKALKVQREKIVGTIHRDLLQIIATYEQYYSPVRQFAEKHPLLKDKIGLSFAVSLEETGLEDSFFERISRGSAGYFNGENGTKRFRDLCEHFDWNDTDDVVTFLVRVLECLSGDSNDYDPKTQLRKGAQLDSLYNLLYGLDYLIPQYKLRLNGKDLSRLSPGERGLLLLVFYLLIDQSGIPLVIDQPEENLDNQTVYQTLVPSIREAKKRRQVIIVTHNPNLAVVCDAEQVIHARINKTEDVTSVVYQAGSLENPSMNKSVLDILEGTRPAFDNRDSKYHK